MTVPTSSNASAEKKSYFDLHISGIGYLKRIREVKPKKGESFLACDIAALNGPADDVSYNRYDCRVSGKEAQHLVRRCKKAVDEEKNVLIVFRLGDPWSEIYTPTKGKNAGKPTVSNKARLLFISWIKIGDEEVYKAERPEKPETPEAKPAGDVPAEIPEIDPAETAAALA